MTARPRAHAPSPSAPAAALAGTWKLERGQALTLRPHGPGILRVARGQLWATREGPHGRTPTDSGDHVLQAGRAMLVRSGERVVIEAWQSDGASYFAWDPLPARSLAPRRRLDFSAVRQAGADLRLALALVLRALGGLASGLARLAWQALRGGAPDRRAHGAAG